MTLNGKSAVITGSLGGIGFATPDVIDARLSELAAFGVRARYHGADLRDPRQIADLVSAAGNGPDILVNNAVIRYFGAVENFAPEHWSSRAVIAVAVAPDPAIATYDQPPCTRRACRALRRCQ